MEMFSNCTGGDVYKTVLNFPNSSKVHFKWVIAGKVYFNKAVRPTFFKKVTS